MLKRFFIMTFMTVIGLTSWPSLAAQPSSETSWMEVRFKGDSTLHGFSGVVTNGTAEHLVPSDTLRITIPVLNLSTDHATRDTKMMKMFEQELFPTITGESPWSAVFDPQVTDVPVHLTIHGVTQTLQVKRTGDGEHILLSCSLSLATFGLTSPSVLGLINVNDLVEITIKRAALEALTGTLPFIKEIR